MNKGTLNYKYVLFNLDYNAYLYADDDLVFKLVKPYRHALIFNTKEEAFSFLDNNKEDIKKLGDDWTSREFVTL